MRYHSLSKEQWISFFQSELFTPTIKDITQTIYCANNHKLNATCIAEILGFKAHQPLNSIVGKTGHAIYDNYLPHNPPIREDNHQINWWHILYDGDVIKKGNHTLFNWIIKPEMLSAIEELKLFRTSEKSQNTSQNHLYPILSEYEHLENLTGEERKAVLTVRQNQSSIRKKTLKKYHGKCIICNMQIQSLLTASHIKPWASSTPEEKGNLNNILLLCPNHNALFDNFLISFSDDGKIMINKNIKETDKQKLNINENISISLNDEMKTFMTYHRKVFLKKEQNN